MMNKAKLDIGCRGAIEKGNAALRKDNAITTHTAIIPPSINKLFAGMARVNRDDFMQRFDVGVPMDATKRGNEEVLILYSDVHTLPHKSVGEEGIPRLHLERAVERCNNLKIILTEPDKKKQCLAIVGRWESCHIQRFLRWDEKESIVKDDFPLRYVSRVPGHNGRVLERPHMFVTNLWNEMVVSYLSSLNQALDKLRIIAKQVAQNNTIVVMVCNHGQSKLLMNFACSARAQGFDLSSQLLVFATDLETKALAEGLGLTAFYDETNYADIPKNAAHAYADRTFSKMMLAKVYCVHMISVLGYDLLFQDVDIVWYQNPLEYFTDTSNPYYDFDIIFQHDGSKTRRYASYSPNTGFYFVRHNPRTEYFIHSLLMQGNLILGSGSHQEALTTVMSEHASWRGLRVKVLSIETMNEFPGGFHFRRRKQFMKDLMEKKVKPYIFHMSWTDNKDNKRSFFEQMGDWHVKEECVGSTASKIQYGDNYDLGKTCCLAETIVKCHYRDKPSKIPCKDSPPIDKEKPSFW